MSIGKINASLAGGLTQETTLALANLNFDFSLCKIEAPMEYHGLGECISKRRRADAEGGNEHVLARKLGALFSHVLPVTPKLVRAYGTRATEIIRENSRRESSPVSDDGVFGEWTGPDATSIWAAATSGSGAIAAHLLACMLARMWTASEAVAIWEAMIEGRKQEIKNSDPANPLWQSQELAAKIEVTKDQISRWDSSARSWLQIADKSRMKQQKQLELLVDNASIPVNQEPVAYRSVMDAWTTALSTVEKLLEGVSQSINEGAVILALTAWHIFPDMFAIGAGASVIPQHDPLYPKGTIVTLGQSTRPPDAASNGVFWSLPLAFLKYYGDPVVRTRTLGESTSRLTFPEVMQVVLGAVLSGWGDYARDLQQACANIVSLADVISAHGNKRPGHPRSWIELLAESAESYMADAGSTRSNCRALTLRGFRRYRHLLWDSDEGNTPFFGLGHLGTVLELIDSMEDKISFLRLIARGLNANPDDVLIRYRVPKERPPTGFDGFFESSNDLPSIEEAEGFGLSWLAPEWTWEYATALEQHEEPITKKRKVPPSSSLEGHIRWTVKRADLAHTGEQYIKLTVVAGETTSRSFKWAHQDSTAISSQPAEWVYVLGNVDEAAIFRRSSVKLSGFEELGQSYVHEILRSGWITPTNLVDLMDVQGAFTSRNSPEYVACLRALAAAAEAYKLMPGATISTDLFSASLKDALWIPGQCTLYIPFSKNFPDNFPRAAKSSMFGAAVDSRLLSEAKASGKPQSSKTETGVKGLRSYVLSRTQVFSCIAMFENRKINLDPGSLDQVMAISAGGSIYVAMPLLSDPFDLVQDNEVKHITGNISKPGLSLMIPPMAPRLRKVDEDKWTLVNHAPFDGRLEDCFQHTSLHLSFTGYQLPMMTAEHGYQGVEANFVETLVSVFDRHEWVADLDVLKALAMPSVTRINEHLRHCPHTEPCDATYFPLTSIDSWDEFIDRPSNACIFRASGNWLARLSAVAVNAQQNLDTIVLKDGKRPCWKCVEKMDKMQGEEARKRLLLVG